MTIIFNTGDFWIEFLTFRERNVTAGALYSEESILERQGICVGVSSVLTPFPVWVNRAISAISVQGKLNGSLIANYLGFGDRVDTIIINCLNEEVINAVNIKASAMVFLRR